MSEIVDKIELRSEEVQEILSKVPSWMIRWGNVLLLILILLLLLLSWLIKYPDIIVTQVIVTTQEPPQKEYSKTTGKLDSILVSNNQKVTINQTLAVIENTANFNDVYFLKSIIDTLQIREKNIFYSYGTLPVLFLGEIEPDFALFENAYMNYMLNKELQPFSNEAQTNSLSIVELNRRLRNTLSQKKLFLSELAFKKKDLSRIKILYKRGMIATQEYENKQQELLHSERNYKNMNQSISQIREALNNANKTSKVTEINKTREEVILLQNLIQSYKYLKKSIKNWELRYVLQSKINGKVSFLNYWNNNQTVRQGDMVFTIIPLKNSSYVAKLKAPAQNSGKIKKGQSVNIKLQNYPETEFGTLNGTIKNISLMPNSEGMYLIDVDLPKKLITSYNKEIAFKQEMSGTAEIITEDLRLIERLLYEFRRLAKRK